MTPQQRTRDNLTARGYLVGTVEKKKKFPDKKKHPCRACGHVPMIEISEDLWSVFDIVAVKPIQWQYDNNRLVSNAIPEIVFIQTTSRANHSTRRNKILASMEAKLVLLSGCFIMIQSWRQEGGAGSRWLAFEEFITLDMYQSAPHYPNTVAELVEIKRKAKKPDLPPGSSLPLGEFNLDETPF